MNTNPDRLYELLPVIHRMRDADQGYPLRALLRVITEQVEAVEEDMDGLYENWFIETAKDWVVPYIGDLIGYRPVHDAGEPGDPGMPRDEALNRILIPRREVANTLHYRRRKGALALLETLANDVAGWPARAVEFFRLLGWTQNVNHRHLLRGRTSDLRDGEALGLLDGPFDRSAHTVDVRRMDSTLTRGRYNIPEVGLFVWRLKTYPVTDTPAHCVEEVGPHCYTFSVLGNDTRLFINPAGEKDPTRIAGEIDVPAPIRRRAFEKRLADFYGNGRSMAVRVADQLLPMGAIKAADLTDWQYHPQRDQVAVDPVLGRIAFPPGQLPKKSVHVSYRYAFSTAMGGGEYDRPVIERQLFTLYRVGETGRFRHVGDALRQWQADKPRDAVIELADSGVYVEPINIVLERDQSLQLRAANRCRPVMRLLDWQTDLPDALSADLSPGSRFTLDGLLITGRSVQIRATGTDQDEGGACPAELSIRHCTLVPGWGLHNDCQPSRPAEPSLELFNVRARVRIEKSILGSIQIYEDPVRTDPIPLSVTDSIIDAIGDEREAIGAPGRPVAHSILTIRRCTVFGIVQVHAIRLAENSIFTNCLNVARRQLGCMRFCYVPKGCRTPKRYHCQPEMGEQAITEKLQGIDPGISQVELDEARALERFRIRPLFNSMRYGNPDYAQLADSCADEIGRGADDESEMGAFHDLYNPQREANLSARLDEYTPAGMDTGIIFQT